MKVRICLLGKQTFGGNEMLVNAESIEIRKGSEGAYAVVLVTPSGRVFMSDYKDANTIGTIPADADVIEQWYSSLVFVEITEDFKKNGETAYF